MEGKLSGAFVASILAKDADEGENGTVTYSLSGTYHIYKSIRSSIKANKDKCLVHSECIIHDIMDD